VTRATLFLSTFMSSPRPHSHSRRLRAKALSLRLLMTRRGSSEHGGLHRISQAMRNPDPREALQQIVTIFCDFWPASRGALALQAASANDPEFQERLRARNERRRQLLSVLVDRISAGGRKPPQVLSELIDVLFALTGLACGGRTATNAPRRRITQPAS
jgi:hypothetical protein